MPETPPETVKKPLRLLWVWSLSGIALFVYMLLGGPTPIAEHGLHGGDFVNIWTGAKLALQGKASLLYDRAAYEKALKELTGQVEHNFSYPPTILMLILVFGLLPFQVSFALWSLSGLAALVAALKSRAPAKLNASALALVATSPAALVNLADGQNGAFTAWMFLGGLYACETSPVPAGLLFGLLTVKPHLGVLIPIVLILRRNWKCFFSAAFMALLLAGDSLIRWGPQLWQDFLMKALPFQTGLLFITHDTFARMMPGVWGDLVVSLGLTPPTAMALFGATAAACGYMTLSAVRRQGLTPLTVLMLALATLIIMPYAFNYDMVMVAGALTVYLAGVAEMDLVTFVLFGMLWALPAAVMWLKLLPIPISSVIMVIPLTYLHRLAQRSKSPE